MKQFFFTLVTLWVGQIYAQSGSFVSLQTGFHLDSYNALGGRFFTEFQRFKTSRTAYGISVEHTFYMGHFMTDYYPGVYSQWLIADYQRYYKLPLWKNNIFYMLGMGGGFSLLSWTDSAAFVQPGVNLNFSITLNFRIGKYVYLETTPVPFIVPFSRFYVHYLPRMKKFGAVYSGTFHAVGLKIKI